MKSVLKTNALIKDALFSAAISVDEDHLAMMKGEVLIHVLPAKGQTAAWTEESTAVPFHGNVFGLKVQAFCDQALVASAKAKQLRKMIQVRKLVSLCRKQELELKRLASIGQRPSDFHLISVAQSAADNFISKLANDWYQSNTKGLVPVLLPDLFKSSGLDEIRVLSSIAKGAFLHGEMSWALAQEIVQNEVGLTLTKEQVRGACDYLVYTKLLTKSLQFGGSYFNGKEIVGKSARHMLSAFGHKILARSHRELPKKTVVFEPQLKTIDNAVKLLGSTKEGHNESRTKWSQASSTCSESALEALNKLASVGFILPSYAVRMLAHSHVADGIQKEGETLEDFQTRSMAGGNQKARLEATILELLGKKFFMPNKFDWRGRINRDCGEFDPTSLKWLRDALQFSEAQAVDQRQIDIQKGLLRAKMTRDKVKHTQDEYETLGREWPINEKGLPLDLKGKVYSPALSLFLNPERAICFIDFSQQGYQIQSLSFGDEVVAKFTNLIGTDINDFYGEVAVKLGLKSRDYAKIIMLPYIYGAGTKAILRDYREEFPEEVVTEDMMKTWITKFESQFPSVKVLRTWIRTRFSVVGNLRDFSEANDAMIASKTPDEISWKVPDDFKVSYKTLEVVNLDVTGEHHVNKDFRIKLRSTTRRCFGSMVTGIAPNLTHSLDSWVLREVVRRCDFDVITIHDSFGCHSCNVDKLRRTIIEVMQQLARDAVMNHILAEMVVSPESEDEWDTIDAIKVGAVRAPLDWTIVTNPNMVI